MSLSVRLCADEHGIITRVHVCAQVWCAQLGICVSWHVRPQHGASMGPVLASWRLNLLRGSTTQWWEVDRTHGGTPTICPWPFPPTRTWCLTALLSPIHLTPFGGGGREGGWGLERCGRGGGANCREGALMTRQQKQQRSAGTPPTSGRSN